MDTPACIRLSSIVSSVYQPRLQQDDGLSELANCIQLNGLKEPPKVLPASALVGEGDGKAKAKTKTKTKGDDEETYLMICGHRRHAALQILVAREVESLPSGNARIDEEGEVWVQVLIPEDRDRQEATFTSLIENVRRKNLSPFELAQSYKVLVTKCGMTRAAVAKKAQENVGDLGYMIRALDPRYLPLPMIASWKDGRLVLGHAKALMRLYEQPDKQLKLYQKILEERLTVSDADFWCAQLLKDEDLRQDEREYVLLEQRMLAHPKLKEVIESKRARLGRSNVGEKLTVKFSSAEELRTFCAAVLEALKDFPL